MAGLGRWRIGSSSECEDSLGYRKLHLKQEGRKKERKKEGKRKKEERRKEEGGRKGERKEGRKEGVNKLALALKLLLLGWWDGQRLMNLV